MFRLNYATTTRVVDVPLRLDKVYGIDSFCRRKVRSIFRSSDSEHYELIEKQAFDNNKIEEILYLRVVLLLLQHLNNL